MFEEQNESLEVRRFELAVNAVERMRDRMRDLTGLQISLERENVVAEQDDVVVLLFGNAPDQNMNLARVLREIGRNLFTNERVRQIANGQTTVDRVVIGDRDEIHPALEQLSMQLPRIGIGIGEIEPPEKPFLGPVAEARVNVEITF